MNYKRKSKEWYMLLTTLLVILGVYAFFFSSQYFFGENILDKKTRIGTEVTVGNTKLKLVDWTISDVNYNSEVVLKLSTESFNTISYDFKAKDFNGKEIEVEKVLDSNGNVILLLKDISKRYNAISLEIIENENGNKNASTKLYTNEETIKTINKPINKKTEQQYTIDIFNRDIDLINKDIKKLEKDIIDKKEKISNIEKLNKELKETDFKTDLQRQEDSKKIEQNNKAKEQLEKDIENNNKRINEAQLRIDNINLKIKELEK